MHVLALVGFLVSGNVGDSCSENLVFGGQLVLGVFGGLLLLRLFGLLAEPAQVLLWLAAVLGVVFLALDRGLALLALDWRLALDGLLVLLALLTFFGLLLLLFGFVFRRHWVKDSGGFLGLLCVDERSNIDNFSLVLIEPSQRNLQIWMSCSISKVVRLHDAGN